MSESLTPERQLELWLAGDSRCPNTRDECCPDFSCCDSKLLAPVTLRRAFVKGDRRKREELCMRFLGGFAETLPEKVHVAGQVPDKEDA